MNDRFCVSTAVLRLTACHAIGYLGGNLGPDLTRVGQIRSERDLLESILLPSASFVRSYEPVQIETRSGKTLSGLVRGEMPAALTLVSGANQQVQVARDEIEAIRPGKVSVMPTGLTQQLSEQQLADLLAFLKS
jgi:putative heme-binding domain-containing protein